VAEEFTYHQVALHHPISVAIAWGRTDSRFQENPGITSQEVSGTIFSHFHSQIPSLAPSGRIHSP